MDLQQNPHSPTKINVSIKTPESEKFAANGPWLTFEGSSPTGIKAALIESFGLSEDDNSLDLYSVVLNAQTIATTQGRLQGSLQGTVLSGKSASTGSASATSAPAESAPAEPEPEANPLLAQIEAATDRQALVRLYGAHKAVFDGDADLLAAWKAKGAGLPA